MGVPSTTGQRPRQAGAPMEFAARLRALMDSRALGVRALARQLPCDPGLISRLANGKQRPSQEIAQRLDDVLEADGELVALASASALAPPLLTGVSTPASDEIAALELARQAAATEVGAPTVEALELAVDDLAVAYHGTAPAALLDRVRSYLDYTGRLINVKATLAEHRRLLISGGWLSLLAATCLIDLHRDRAAAAHLRTATQLARETEHPEIAAWCLETRAWQLLISGNYKQAIQIAQGAQRVAPRGSSAYIQATAQEGRAWARLKTPAETRDALARVERLVAPLPMPDRPEHHYRYDPAKSQAYVATTLSWLGDPAAEDQARQVLARIESTTDGPSRPRRAASARLDLSLALTITGRHDEAAGTALEAITSGRLTPSTYWRAREIVEIVVGHNTPGSKELSDAYRRVSQSNTPPMVS
jgi:transcriptional regulator with XRE-family HTH domain